MKQGAYGVMILLLLLTGCSTMKVAADFSEGTDFSNFRTFQYRESDTTFGDTSPFVHQLIVDAIKGEMIAQGFTEVDSNPDVYVSYYSRVDEQYVINTTQRGYTYGRRWYQLRWQWGDGGIRRLNTTTTDTTYRRGTLVVDMWEARQKELVWRGIISDVISEDPGQDTDIITRGISRVFQKYPPVARS